MIKLKLFLAACLIFIIHSANAQTVYQNTGWTLFLNSTKLSDRWSTHFDFQLRTADEWKHLRNVLIRPGVTYHLNKNANLTLGYLYTTTYNGRLIGTAKNLFEEHRIWQQFIYNQKPWSGATLTHRFRLEQRFIEQSTADVFSQRLRYFIRLVHPIQKQETGFTNGIFVAAQNELFFNVQNQDDLNGKLFDQNRAYLAAGYRISKKLDLELGYLNQYVKGKSNETVNNAIQLAIYTRF
jgi:hypothetical protein